MWLKVSYAYLPIPSNRREDVGKYEHTVKKTLTLEGITADFHTPVTQIGKPRLIRGIYSYTPGQLAGVTTAYNWISLFNPNGSGIIVAVRQLVIIVGCVAASLMIDHRCQRTTAASGGTLVSPAALVKHDTTFPDPKVEVRIANPTVTAVGDFLSFAVQLTAGNVLPFVVIPYRVGEEIILREGQGINVRQMAAGDADQRLHINLMWEEFVGIPRVS